MSEDPRHLRGRQAEDLAERELRRLGYQILARNWECPAGELDIVARDGEDLVVVEVKSRSTEDWGGPEGAISPSKRRKLSRLMLWYVTLNELGDVNCRFDVVAIVKAGEGRPERIEVYQDAFDYLGR
ncbi:MAG: YraN family protein [Armatimonadetes bacterium]|nr:YraN family protein [Armatimonadota bacterium]